MLKKSIRLPIYFHGLHDLKFVASINIETIAEKRNDLFSFSFERNWFTVENGDDDLTKGHGIGGVALQFGVGGDGREAFRVLVDAVEAEDAAALQFDPAASTRLGNGSGQVSVPIAGGQRHVHHHLSCRKKKLVSRYFSTSGSTVEFGYIIHGIYHPAAYIGHFRAGPNFYMIKPPVRSSSPPVTSATLRDVRGNICALRAAQSSPIAGVAAWETLSLAATTTPVCKHKCSCFIHARWLQRNGQVWRGKKNLWSWTSSSSRNMAQVNAVQLSNSTSSDLVVFTIQSLAF